MLSLWVSALATCHTKSSYPNKWRSAVCTGLAPASGYEDDPTAAPSYVPNSFYSFPYVPTSFANSALCASATKTCSKVYDACVTSLWGGGHGVTIIVSEGGGTTVKGDVLSYGPSATSICSSLRSQACSDLEATGCNSFGQASTAAKVRTGPLVVITAGIAVFPHLISPLTILMKACAA